MQHSNPTPAADTPSQLVTRAGIHEAYERIERRILDLANVLNQIEDLLEPVLVKEPAPEVVPGPLPPTPPRTDSPVAAGAHEFADRIANLTNRLCGIRDRIDL